MMNTRGFIVGDTDNGGVFGSNNWDQAANDLMEKMMYSGTCAVGDTVA